MPRFAPFAGLRFSTDVVGPIDEVSCPPYDVISRAEHLALLARNPHNVVRLEMPDDPTQEQGDGCYPRARAVLDTWRAEGALRRDPAPAFYGYRTSGPADDHAVPVPQTVGVIGALALGDGVLPHEQTTPKARTDRRRLLEELRVNVSPIWALTPTSGLAALAGAPPSTPGVPAEGVDHALDGDGVLHELWPIVDPVAIGGISALVGLEPVLLADGHHRYETALAYRSAREATGVTDPGAGALMAYVVELSEQQLQVQGIHRLVRGLPRGEDPLGLLRRAYTLEPTGPPDASLRARMEAAGAVGVLTASGTWLARASMATVASATHDLDASRLDVALGGLAGRPDVEVVHQHGWEEVASAVTGGRADLGVVLRPPTIGQIAQISRGGVRMPAKTTFFWPKPRTGLVLRELDT